jgi:NTE family protein
MLESGALVTDGKYKRIMVRVIELSPSRVQGSLGAASKLNRDPGFIRDLMAHGQAQADEFLTALEFEHAWRHQDEQAVMSFFADDVTFVSSPPFPDRDPAAGVDHLSSLVTELLAGIMIDTSEKQVARDRIVWTVRAESRSRAPRFEGQAEITLQAGKITTLRLGPRAPTR